MLALFVPVNRHSQRAARTLERTTTDQVRATPTQSSTRQLPQLRKGLQGSCGSLHPTPYRLLGVQCSFLPGLRGALSVDPRLEPASELSAAWAAQSDCLWWCW